MNKLNCFVDFSFLFLFSNFKWLFGSSLIWLATCTNWRRHARIDQPAFGIMINLRARIHILLCELVSDPDDNWICNFANRASDVSVEISVCLTQSYLIVQLVFASLRTCLHTSLLVFKYVLGQTNCLQRLIWSLLITFTEKTRIGEQARFHCFILGVF